MYLRLILWAFCDEHQLHYLCGFLYYLLLQLHTSRKEASGLHLTESEIMVFT